MPLVPLWAPAHPLSGSSPKPPRVPQSDVRLLKLYESGLPAWAVFLPSYGVCACVCVYTHVCVYVRAHVCAWCGMHRPYVPQGAPTTLCDRVLAASCVHCAPPALCKHACVSAVFRMSTQGRPLTHTRGQACGTGPGCGA